MNYFLFLRHLFQYLIHYFLFVILLLNYLFYILIIAITGLTLILYRKILKDNILWVLIGVNIICYVIFLLLAPQKVMRYTESLFPVLALIIPAIILEAKKLKPALISIVCLILVISFVIPSKFESYDSMLNPPRVSMLTGNIENIFSNTNCEPIKNSNSSLLITETNGWNILNIIPYLNDEQVVKIDY